MTNKYKLHAALLIAGVIVVSLIAIQFATGTVKYDLDTNDTIVNLSSPSFRYSVIVETMTAPATPAVSKGYLYEKTDKLIYFKNSDGTEYDLTAGVVGGSDKQIQYNNGGVMAGTSTFTIETASNTVYISTALVLGDSLVLEGSGKSLNINGQYASTRELDTDYSFSAWNRSHVLNYKGFTINSTGTIRWGDQINGTDVGLSRNAPGTLIIDGSLYASSITVAGFAASSSVVLGSGVSITSTTLGVIISSSLIVNGGISASSSIVTGFSVSSSVILGLGISLTTTTANIIISTNIFITGKVGIGASALTNKLNVVDNSTSLTFTSGNSAVSQFVNSDNTNNNMSGLVFSQVEGAAAGAGLAGVHTDHTPGARKSDLTFYTMIGSVAGERVRIKSSGEVIISSGITASSATFTNGISASSITVSGFIASTSVVFSPGVYISSKTYGLYCSTDIVSEGTFAASSGTFTYGLKASSITSTGFAASTSVVLGTGVSITSTTIGVTISSSLFVNGGIGGSSITVTGFSQSSSVVLSGNISITSTTTGMIFSSNTYTVGYSSCAGQVFSNNRKVIDTYDYCVTISTPSNLSTALGFPISAFRGYAITITSITMQAVSGTNCIAMIEQRPSTNITAAGTDIWIGDVTALTGGWYGGTESDFTVPANSALFLSMTSVTGAVDMLVIKYTITKD